jgi:uncharacterized protein (TIGR02001 family)
MFAGFLFTWKIKKGRPMKKLILASAVSAAFIGSVAQAEQAATPEHSVTYNVGIASEYRYRGISQSRKEPAFSFGADYTNNPTGIYVGAWASTIKWVKDAGGDGNSEIDVYAGKRGQISGDLTYDVGVLTYYYPSNKLQFSTVGTYANANSTEVYGQIGYGPAYLKYSHALTNLFGSVDSKNSYYIDLGANVDIADKTQLNLHVGRQHVAGSANVTGSYTDWKVGVTKDFGFVTGALSVVGTNANETFYTFGDKGYMGRTAGVLTLTKTF